MNINVRTTIAYLLSAATAVITAVPGTAQAGIAQTPLTVAHAVRPRVMFAMSNDHALYYKAYTDWNDLDLDGDNDTTYQPGLKYYGYFDPGKCYNYSNGQFEPAGITADGYCDQTAGDWSGNFMNWATMSRMDIVRKVLYGGYRSTDAAGDTILERAFLPTDAHSFAKFYDGFDIDQLTPFDVAEITLCNTTYEGDSVQSQNVTEPPLIRVARGDFRYWAANERWQCTWDNEHGNNSSGTNSTGSETRDPNKTNDGLGSKDYIARVQVCVPGLIGTESCKRYPSGSYKPTGLLHDYGEDDQILFGLMTGSYQKNKSGGVLRKNAASFVDEVNLDTDGTFTGADGIVSTLDRLRIARYHYNNGLYNSSDSCPWGRSSFNEGRCSNWGNPLSEIYLEALRYFAGLSPTAAFNGDDTGYISGLTDANWTDPLDSDTWCAHCDIILINASGSSYDDDAVSGAGLNGAPNPVTLTNAVGDAEGISGNDWFVGENGTDNNQLCTGKRVDNLGDVRGACPGEPRLSGTYLLAGLAHWAKTHDIRPLTQTQNVTTRAVALLPAAPQLEIPVPGSEHSVSILPACRNYEPNPHGNCGLVDFKILSQDLQAGTGTAYVNWEDTEQGGDYDQDMKGILSYSINPGAGTITVTTDANAKSTPHVMGFGYVISGTTSDGFHVHSGINGFDYTDPDGGLGCNNCQHTNAATSRTYTLGQSTAGLLKPPLWYASKYGSFEDTNNNDLPDQQPEWDADADGQPDGFFLANNPGELGPSLARFLDIIATISSAAAAAANSTSLSTDSKIYQARYDSSNWTGDLLAFPINQDGTLADSVWSARDELEPKTAGQRIIITSITTQNGTQGVPFRWSAGGIPSGHPQRDDLRRACPTCNLEAESVGEARLDWLRGDITQEASHGGVFRDRDFKLGDIVDSSPRFVGDPLPLYPEDIAPSSYHSYRLSKAGRTPMLYVGANDGMLHGFSADTGEELFAYVPRGVYPHLSALPSLGYQDSHRFYVDGGPSASDAYLGANLGWRTVLAAGLGAGGAGVFALDVTDPSAFTVDEANADDQVLWDITNEDPGFEHLGFAFSRPAVVRLPDGNLGGVWAAVFGNGYHEAEDDPYSSATLYIVDAATGDLLDTVQADRGLGNGLSSVVPVDTNGDGRVDYIYAGDMKGNMWRFEPNGAAGWQVSFNGEPLFSNAESEQEVQTTIATPQADQCEEVEVCTGRRRSRTCSMQEVCTPQPDLIETFTETVVIGAEPITVRPDVTRHPNGGVMVLFGSGAYYRDQDRLPDDTQTHAFYGIWDKLDGTADIGTEHLLQQHITAETTAGDYEVRVTSTNDVTWHTGAGKPADSPPSTHLGWFVNLVDPNGLPHGEIQVTDPQIRGGRVIFTSLIPSDLACAYGGIGWLMELQALTGLPDDRAVFDLNGDRLFNDQDLVRVDLGNGQFVLIAPGGKKSKVGAIQRPAIVDAGLIEYKYASGAREGAIEITAESVSKSRGRSSWFQLH